MPTYISLIRFTQKGVETIREGPKRLDVAKQAFRDAGAELKAFYLVTGQYDAVAISEVPNDCSRQAGFADSGNGQRENRDPAGVQRGRVSDGSSLRWADHEAALKLAFITSMNIRNQGCRYPSTRPR